MSARIFKLVEAMRGECTGAQMVIGGAPEGAGLVGAALVLECKDAAKVKGMLAEMTKIVPDFIKDADIPDRALSQLSITYTAAKDSTGMDVIEITHPELLSMPDEQKKMLKSIIGEDVLRIQVASVDGAVVLTFGGGEKFMAEALKAAKGGGTIPAEAGVKEVMKVMPKNLTEIVLFNPSNLLTLISKGAELVGQGDAMPPIKLTTQTPIAVGTGVTGSAQHVRVYVPVTLVKEATNAIMGLIMGGMGGGRPAPMPMPAGGPENF
ncbi:MAG: hypothetical protein EHM48_09980 [Planctomycetaceae bacterium]|nr:MAG: hypothetical protein EHM48_09980 [Planctomycetaceae bacterium]